jgi:hypothetical protein
MLIDSWNMADGLVYVEALSLTFKDREGTPLQQYNKFVLHFVLKMIQIANLSTHQVGDRIGVTPPPPPLPKSPSLDIYMCFEHPIRTFKLRWGLVPALLRHLTWPTSGSHMRKKHPVMLLFNQRLQGGLDDLYWPIFIFDKGRKCLWFLLHVKIKINVDISHKVEIRVGRFWF